MRRGWAPRALLGALSAPVGVVGGLGLAVASAVLDRPALAVVGVAVAGVPALYHAGRSALLGLQLDAVRAARRETLADLAAARRALADLEATVPVEAPEPVTTRPFGLVDARIDTGELQRIWDLGEAPESTRPQVTVAEPRVLVGFLGERVEPGRPRVGTFDDRVFDAIVAAEADAVTRALELPARRGRHAAELPLDAPMVTGRDLADSRAVGTHRPALEVVRRRGKHVA